MPNGFQAAPCPEKLIEIESLLPGDPWLAARTRTPPAATTASPIADLERPTGSARGDVAARSPRPAHVRLHYDHTKSVDRRQEPAEQPRGDVLPRQLAARPLVRGRLRRGVGQRPAGNFGRGGMGGDPILAEGNDFSGTDNANMSTPPDGASPRMQMFEFYDGPNPCQPDQQPRGADHVSRDGPLHHQPAGRRTRSG